MYICNCDLRLVLICVCMVVVWGWREKEKGERIVDGRTVNVEEEIRSDWVP